MHAKLGLVSLLFLLWLKTECLREIQEYYLSAAAFINITSNLILKIINIIWYSLLSTNLLFGVASTIGLKLRSFICFSAVLLGSLSDQQAGPFVLAVTGGASVLFEVPAT